MADIVKKESTRFLGWENRFDVEQQTNVIQWHLGSLSPVPICDKSRDPLHDYPEIKSSAALSVGLNLDFHNSRITPSCTPCTPSSAASYRPYPPPELTSTWNQTKFPQRINPLAPPYPKKRINSSWETIPQHWHNEKRRTMMQQKEHERYHSAWSIPFYGPPADKEAYRRHFREVLKQQMADLADRNRTEFKARSQESQVAVEYDRQCKVKDLQEIVNKFSYLKRFRDDNKVFMEEAWQRSRTNKTKTDKYDKEILRYNPINWSGTLT